MQAHDGWHTFYALRQEKKVARARVHFHLHNGVASSPYRNPFGSYEFSDAMSPKELYEFIRWTEGQLYEKGARQLEIKSYPQLYHKSRSALLTTFLLNQGYQVVHAELSACIPVRGSALYESMTSWEKRKLGQARRSNLRFVTVPLTRLKEVHDFISSCREERRQSLSMTYSEIRQVSDTFPDRFRLFGLFDGTVFTAASICIVINKTILYNFYSAHARSYDALSPVVRLMEGIYEYCQADKVEWIDLGTSSLHGKPNFSLLDFKLHLGAQPTQKLTFQKQLA